MYSFGTTILSAIVAVIFIIAVVGGLAALAVVLSRLFIDQIGK